MTIQLPPEIEASLIAQARAQAVSVEEYVARVLQEKVSAGASLSGPRRAEGWRRFAARFPNTPPLSDDAVSRERIYGERG